MIHASEKQYDSFWWSARRGLPSASNAGKVFTSQGKRSESQLAYINSLIGDLYDPQYGNKEDYQSAAMKNGLIVEPEARAFFEFQTGKSVEEVGLCVSDDGHACASPDGLVGEDSGVEIKSPIPSTQVKYLLADKVPAIYVPQINFSMVVTGRDSWWFLSYCRGLPYLLKEVIRDEYTDKMAEEMEKFWVRYQEQLGKIRDLDHATAFEDKQQETAVAQMF